MELTSDDRMNARNLGGDEAERYEHTGVRPQTMGGHELWDKIMGAANRDDYPVGAIADLRIERDFGFESYL
jgi:hypothetical protein